MIVAFSISLALATLVSAGLWNTWNQASRPVLGVVASVEQVEERTTADQIPLAVFTDVTDATGIRFEHTNGAQGNLWMPEMMGAGCAFLDFDNDDDQDLLLINSASFAADQTPEGTPATSRLYRNDGTGKFDDVTTGSGLDISQYGMGAAVGDVDGDGRIDIFFASLGGGRLFKNLGDGKFLDVTAQARVAGHPEDWSTSCAFFDFDRDSDLDLFVCNYGRWSPELEERIAFSARGNSGKAGLRNYLNPGAMDAVDCYLYRNRGDGTFDDISAAAGIHVRGAEPDRPVAQALGVRPLDIDGDGWLDIVVANDLPPQFLFHNLRNGTFEEIGVPAGIAFDRMGRTIAGMGVDVGYVGLKNAPVIAVGNFSELANGMFVLLSDGRTFIDAADRLGVRETIPMTTFGLFFFDYDLDGRLDLFQTNGHVYTKDAATLHGAMHRQPSQLFWKAPPGGDREFLWVPPELSGTAIHREILGRGAAYADVDGDGDLDVVVTENAGPATLFRNDQMLGNHWLRVRLVGKPPNTSAIGATVRISVAGQEQVRMVMPGRSYLSQVELPLTFGLGSHSLLDDLEIAWPDGTVQRVDPPQVDRQMTVVQTP